jgi:hypothetical protein
MKTVARILTRLQGEGDGLFVGALFKGGTEFFKPNTIYEIRECLGELRIVEVGQAAGAGPNNCASGYNRDNGTQFSWAEDIGNVLAKGGRIFLTREESLAQNL